MRYHKTEHAYEICILKQDGSGKEMDLRNRIFSEKEVNTGRQVEMDMALNGSPDKACRKILENVSGGIHAFVQEAPQFDDITMVALTYYGETGEH